MSFRAQRFSNAQRPDRLSEKPTVAPTAEVLDCTLGAWTEVGSFCKLLDTVLDDYSYLSDNCRASHAIIGKFVNIAPYCAINPPNHPTWRAALHHFTYRSWNYNMGEDDPEVFGWRAHARVTLEHDVWIGHGATVLPGRKVGLGSVVGAGSVVTKDIPPYTIAAGVPARPIRARFSPPVQKAMTRIAWWNWSHERLRRALPDFRKLDAEAFCLKYDQRFRHEAADAAA